MRYDTTLKALLEQPPHNLLRLLLGEPVRVHRMLPTELPLIQGIRPDLVLELEDRRIVHIELQAQADKDFTTRMLRYWERLYVKYERAPLQIVLWAGRHRVALESGIRQTGLHFRYRVVDLKTLDTDRLLRSAQVNENLFGLLGKLENPRLSIRRVLHRIAELPVANQQKDAIQKLLVVSGLRAIEPLVLEESETMPITIRMEENLFLKRAFEKGQVEGEQKGREKGLEQGLERGLEQGRLREARAMLLRLLEKRFGAVPARIKTRIEKADLESLETWSLRILEAATIRDIF